MKKIAILSGKGGTGKTSLCASFALLAGRKIICDCDVEAPDLHLVLQPKILHRESFYGMPKAKLYEEKCQLCGLCVNYCRFEAISKLNGTYFFDSISCEGCGVCAKFCPAEAIKMERVLSGEWFISMSRAGIMVHAKLGVAEGGSGKLVSTVIKAAEKMAEKEVFEYILIDGPPGIGCPVIATLSRVDLALIVTEPTTAGIHDLERILDLSLHFKVTPRVIINKFDLNMKKSKEIEGYCLNKGIPLLGKLPYNPIFSEAIRCGKAVIEIDEEIARAVSSIWNEINIKKE